MNTSNDKIEDLERQLRWYKNTYEYRSLGSIVKDRIKQFLKSILRRLDLQQTLPPTSEKEGHIYNYPKSKYEKSSDFKKIKKFFYRHDEQPILNKYNTTVDIILPIYNGLSYLETLVPQILKNSDLSFNLYLLNDCSPDKEIKKYLDSFSTDKRIHIIHNEKNLGFTGTVNKGLKLAKNDVVLLNSDTEVPEEWLSRLFQPIFEDATIGTATPFSNCATIFSFPEWDDNELYLGLPINKLDAYFKKNLKPIYYTVPTGVGFCMAISKKLIQEIGILDEKNFPQGFGEETDFCRRAMKKGYKNVFVPNLFVYHKHGGSFLSEVKEELSQKHQARIEALYPRFMPEVKSFIQDSEQADIRKYQELLICNQVADKTFVYFDHELGGGANLYTDNFIKEQKRKHTIIRISFIHPYHNAKKRYAVRFFFQNKKGVLTTSSLDELSELLDYLQIHEVIVGSLITYEHLESSMNTLHNISKNKKIPLKYLVHDFHSVCVNFNLMYKNDFFCNVPEMDKCNNCLQNVSIDPVLISKDYTQLTKYRALWLTFLSDKVQEIVCFSNSAKKIILKAYPSIPTEKISVIPHQIPSFKTTNIAVIGHIHSKFKGGEILYKMANILAEENEHQVKLIVFGELGSTFRHSIIREKGSYQRDQLFELLRINNIHGILIPSIYSETFSYTTAESILTNLPVFCYDIGGQADQVKAYRKGVIIDKIDAQTTLNTITSFFKQSETL